MFNENYIYPQFYLKILKYNPTKFFKRNTYVHIKDMATIIKKDVRDNYNGMKIWERYKSDYYCYKK